VWHQSILLTQGPIQEILAVIAQLLVVVEKLSFFESAILNFFAKKKKIASFLSKLVNIYGIARMITLVFLYFCNTVYTQVLSKTCVHTLQRFDFFLNLALQSVNITFCFTVSLLKKRGHLNFGTNLIDFCSLML
jgi:hypothetical protein